MKRLLLTGMSGTGKSAVLQLLCAEDTITIDLDGSEWVEWNPMTGDRQFRILPLLEYMRKNAGKNIVLAGCEANQGELYDSLDAVILLTAPLSVMRERIERRKDNPYGKTSGEWAQIVDDKERIEPLLAGTCTYICRTDRPMEEVVRDIRRFMRG